MIFCGALIVYQHAHYFAVSCIIGLKKQIIDSMESEHWCINCSCRSMMLREMMHFSSFTIFAVDFYSDLRRATTQRTYVQYRVLRRNSIFTHIQSLFDGSFFCCSSNLLKFIFFLETDRFSLILKQITEKTNNFFSFSWIPVRTAHINIDRLFYFLFYSFDYISISNLIAC